MSAQSRPARLRALLGSAQTEFMLEAHSGISARVAEEAGFRGIWASGLAMSALCGVRDNNELSASQVLQIVEFMAASRASRSWSTATPATATSTAPGASCASWSSTASRACA
jgi:2-methylisocitrate lyase-like PEP mutase family enzyme